MGNACCADESQTSVDLRQVRQRSLARREDKKPDRPANAASLEDFNMKKVIGVGSYGKVFLVQHKVSGKHYAMKKIKKELVFRTYQDEGIKGKWK